MEEMNNTNEVLNETNEPLLPSEEEALSNEAEQVQKEIQDLTKGLDQYIKDGMIDGKFKSIDDLIRSYRELEAKYANTKREVVQTQKEQEQQIKSQQEQQAMLQRQQEVINELLPKFIENKMQLTDDMLEKAKEVGIDERDLKLGAYEIKEATMRAYNIVGGEDNYKAMLEWAKDNLPDDKKMEFDKGLANPATSEYAIKGLWYEYQQNKQSTNRIQGNPASSGLKPYTSRQELYRDKDAAEQAKRRGDRSLWDRYRQRLAITPQEVIGI